MPLRIAVLALVLATGTARAQPGPDMPPAPPAAPAITDESPVIDLVTMGIGSLIWERHGHIALCVTEHGLGEALRHPGNPNNFCYNYGIGDFHQPVKMAWGFFRAADSFWVGKDAPERMLEVYLYFDRTVWVQPLPLNAAQKTKVIAKLEHDILPENRNYSYDHFADNCTTRIRDIIDNVTDGSLSKMTELGDGKTFRDLARDGFIGMKSMSRLSLLITDMAMGRSTDRVPTYWERMFLPQFLREAVAKRFNITPIPIYTRKECRGITTPNCVMRGVDVPDDGPSGRVIFALIVIALTAPSWATRLWGRFQRIGLAVSILPYALLGTVLTFLAAISPLPYVRWNESCLVYLPIDLVAVFLSSAQARKYARGRVVMLGLIAVLLVLNVFHQPLWAPLLWPLIPMAALGFMPNESDKKK
jgi:hypothetical protein